jgi:hypothetical protein
MSRAIARVQRLRTRKRQLETLRAERIEQQALALARLAPPPEEPEPPPPSTEPGAPEEGILDLFERVSPRFLRPEHFAAYASKLELGVGGGLRLVFAAPPQHGKSETTLHGLAWHCLRQPTKRHAYITYSLGRARRMARKFKNILAALGIVAGGTLECLFLPGGGQVLFTSIDGGITGEPVDGVCLIDDPFKNRKEADSSARRRVVEESYRDNIETRVHPGASIFLLATRWHPEDLSGVLIKDGWENINLPAIAENDNDPNGRKRGEPLFPRLWSLEDLQKKKAAVGEHTWASLYQGRPRPRGGKVFRDAHFYQKLPERYRGGFGLDLAFTAKTNADHSVCAEVWREPPSKPGELARYYLVHVDMAQVEAPEFALTLKARNTKRPAFRMYWRSSGTEKGSGQFLKKIGLPLRMKPPLGDKFVSAQGVAAAWNSGRFLLPDEEAFPKEKDWLYRVIDLFQNFTGIGDEEDDVIDACGNVHDALDAAPPPEDGAMIINPDDD